MCLFVVSLSLNPKPYCVLVWIVVLGALSGFGIGFCGLWSHDLGFSQAQGWFHAFSGGFGRYTVLGLVSEGR